MYRTRTISFILMVMILLLTACSGDTTESEKVKAEETAAVSESGAGESTDSQEEQTEGQESNSEPVTADPLPQTLEELEQLPPGYTTFLSILEEEDQAKIDELTAHLPDISGEPTENELNHYYNQLLAVFQQDFEGPSDLIARLKFQSIGSPDITNPRMQFKENMNVLVILDASGSMGNSVGGQTQMDAAKKAILQFVENLPTEANVGLRVYGHKGSGSSADKAMSCSSSDLLYPLQAYDKAAFSQSLDSVKPAGWTPTELAIKEAKKDLAEFDGEQNTNIVYLVGDGISTCSDDPVAAAKDLYDSNITPIINVIGFNVDHEGQRQLKEVAKAVEGTYQDVQDAASLQKELEQASVIAKQWADWKKRESQSLSYERVKKDLEIFVFDSQQFTKIVNERQRVGFVLQYLRQTKKKMSSESYDYLVTRNKEYHQWIQSQYDTLKADLKNLNEVQYSEAIESLETKYLQNVSE